MRLFYAPQSPFARKVRAAAIELGLADRIELEYAEVIPGKPNKSFAQLHNPLRKVPALLTDDGNTIYDSTVICEYLDALAGGGILIPSEPNLRWSVLTSHALAQGMCEAIILARYETWLRPEPYRWDRWLDDQWDKINAGIGWFEQHASELEDPINLAHLTLGCALGYIEFRWPGHPWKTSFPAVSIWFSRLMQRPSFTLTMPEAPPEA